MDAPPMPILALLLIACQVFCGLHVVRSGQERYWLYLIIALPGLGCLIYALGIMLPVSYTHLTLPTICSV